jgi:hypothetical protein
MGAGIQGFEAADAADDHGFIVVVGSCDTVGVAGGFTQGISKIVCVRGYLIPNWLD